MSYRQSEKNLVYFLRVSTIMHIFVEKRILTNMNVYHHVLSKAKRIKGVKFIIYLIRRCRLYRYYRLLKESQKRTMFFEKHYPSYSNDDLRKVIEKSKKAWMKYQMGYNDFFTLHCEDKQMAQIGEYLSFKESKLFCKVVNSTKSHKILNNKYVCYKHFCDYYGRSIEIITPEEINSGAGLTKLKTFVESKPAQPYIIKPYNCCCGYGIKMLSSTSDIWEYIQKLHRGVVIEEVIVQDESLAAFNQSSVNTLRIQTANYGNGTIDVLWPCLRMGRKGSIVDNAGAGGIFSAIDVNTGKTIAAMDELRHAWTVHPDSKKDLIGFTIPRWQEAVALAKELARKLPDAGFVAWDLALTKRGWVMVEGNALPLLIYQFAVGKGIRQEYCDLKKKYKFSVWLRN